LKDGDEVCVTIEKIGTVAESRSAELGARNAEIFDFILTEKEGLILKDKQEHPNGLRLPEK